MAAETDASTGRPGFPLTPENIEAIARVAPALGAILNADEAARMVRAYIREDARAIAHQTRFAKVASRLNGSVLASAIVGSLILGLGVLQPGIAQSLGPHFATFSWVLGALGFVGLLIGGYSVALLYELNAGDLARYWMESRAFAEHLRGEFFDFVVSRAVNADAATRAAATDLVITHLLEDQRDYFEARGARHVDAAGKWLRIAAFATGLSSVGVAAGGMAEAAGSPLLLAVAALGAAGAAVASFANTQEAIGQERERAQRFRNNRDALDALARHCDRLREASGDQNSDALITFTRAINQQLALELGRFLQDGEAIRASMEKLSRQIEEGRKKAPEPARKL